MKRLRKIKLKYFIILMMILITYFFLSQIVSTFMRYYNQVSGNVVGYGSADYSIAYELNGGTQAAGQVEHFKASTLPITLLDPTREGYTFLGWYEEDDFSGERVTQITTVQNYTLYANWVERIVVAEIDGTFYETLQAAIDAVPTTNTETTVKMLTDISENITIAKNQKMILDFQGYTLSNAGENPTITNNGTISITNGSITTSADTAGAINNNATGTLTIHGGRIITTTGRQTLYNKGTVTITGDAYLENNNSSNIKNNRASITNTDSGKLTILSGTIISKCNPGVTNEKKGTLTIGENDGDVNIDSPVLMGISSGLNITSANSGKVKVYDGIFKGKTTGIANIDYVIDTEFGYGFTASTENIEEVNYNTAYLTYGFVKLKYNANGGTGVGTHSYKKIGDEIGTLPIPTRSGYVFDWWYTSLTGGEEVLEEEIMTEDREIYAHWTLAEEAYVAEIDGTQYYSLQEALNTITDSTETTVKLLRTTRENVVVEETQNMVLNLQSHTLRNINNDAIIENTGMVTIFNGTIKSTSINTSAVNNQANASFTMNGGKIIARGGRQALWNNGGTAIINGSSYLSATTNLRAAVHNLSSGTMTITGGTIVSTAYSAVYNESGNLTIGMKDNVVDIVPLLRGNNYGVSNASIFNFYDGNIGGKIGGIEGGVTDLEEGYQTITVEEIYNGQTYEMVQLTPIVVGLFSTQPPIELENQETTEENSNDTEENISENSEEQSNDEMNDETNDETDETVSEEINSDTNDEPTDETESTNTEENTTEETEENTIDPDIP